MTISRCLGLNISKEYKKSEMESWDFFISHNRKDNATIEPIVDILRRKGYTCWFDKDQTDPNFMISFIRGVKASSRFLFFLSPNSLQAKYCTMEVKQALDISDDKNEKFIQAYEIDNIDRNIECNINIMLSTIAPCECKGLSTEDIVERIIKFNEDIIPCNGQSKNIAISTYGVNDVEKRRLMLQARVFANATREIFDKILLNYSAPKILDLGCSNGDEMLYVLSNTRNFSLIGIDNDEEAIRLANTKDERARYYSINVTDSDFLIKLKTIMQQNNIEKFDIINISLLLLLLNNDEPITLLKSIKDVLSDDGYMIITEYENSFSCASTDEHGYFSRFAKLLESDTNAGNVHFGRSVYKLLYDAGYKNITIEKCGYPYMGYSKDDMNDIFDIEFGFLEDDFKCLSETNPDKKALREGYEWLKENTEKARKEFLQDGFLYFSGYIILKVQK